MSGTDTAMARRLLRHLDLTCLDEDAGPAEIARWLARARTPAGDVAAVCVYPEYVLFARRLLPARPNIPVATVVNFPDGGDDPDRVRREVRRALAAGAGEIDAVLPWRAFRAGEAARVQAVLAALRDACGAAPLKVILECGRFDDPARLRAAALLALDAGADLLKTATGKDGQVADPASARVLLEAIASRGGRAGFKAAGGIRTVAAAGDYLRLAERVLGPSWPTPARFRIGASGLWQEIADAVGITAPPTPAETAWTRPA